MKVNSKIEKIFTILNKKTDARIGFTDIDLWSDSGIYALNRKLSNDYHKCLLYGSQFGLYGESGSGKSLMLAQMAAREQQARGAYVLWIDVEGAVSDLKEGTKWFEQIGVKTDSAFFKRIHICTFRDALVTMSEFVNVWREDEFTRELPPLFIVFDSYSNLQTDTMIEQNKGKKELTSDMGQKAKQLGDFLVRSKGMIEGLRILMTGVMHVYMSQEMYGAAHKISGGMKAVFTASQSLILLKYELTNEKASPHLRQSTNKDDIKEVIGIKTIAKTLKTRYAKPYEKVELEAVYGLGIDKYSGLFDMLIDDKTIYSPSHGWYEFKRPDTSTQKFRRGEFTKYADELLTFPVPERVINKEEDIDKEIFDEETGEVL